MSPFFSSPNRIETLHRVAGSWIGTPFHPNAMVKGRGASCQMLVAGVLLECGHLGISESIPEGPMDWHGTSSLIEQALDGPFARKFETILGAPVGAATSQPPHPPAGDPLLLIRPGDVIGFKIGGSVHHCGIMLNEAEFFHTMRHSKAAIATIFDATWCGRLRRIWRPIE